VLHVVGLGESRVDQLIGDLIQSGQTLEVGLLASQGEIKVRIAARTGSDSEAQTIIGPIEREIRSRLGNNIFGQDSDTLEEVIDSLLKTKNLNLATFETFTGGLAAQRLHHFPSNRISKSTVIPDKKRVIKWLGHNNMEQIDTTAVAIARKLINARKRGVGLAILGFPEKREEGYSIKGYAAVAGEEIERSYSWIMGGDLNTLKQRGAVIGLNTLRLSLL
jgi:nicotinamide-nucleotide amidase